MLVEVRRPWRAGLVVDEHTGRLAGLVLAELEVDDLAAPLPPVPGLDAEVTSDERYAGAALARAGQTPEDRQGRPRSSAT